MKKTISTIIFLVVALGLMFASYKFYEYVTAEPPPKVERISVSESEAPPREVQVVKVANKDIRSGFSAQGRLRAYDKMELVSEVSGMMKPPGKRFKIGTRYTKGEVMFEIENEEVRLGLQAQKAQLLTAITQMMPDLKTDMPDSYQNWKSYVDAFKLNSTIRSFPQPVSDREKYFISARGLQAQYYNIKSTETRLDKYRLIAPFDGILTAAAVDVGGFIRAGVALGQLMNTSLYELEAAVQVADLKYIKSGQQVKVVSDDSGKKWNGTVKRIGDQVNPSTQAATVFISLSGKGLREGQYLRAEINTSAIRKAAKIPQGLVMNGKSVFVVRDSGLVAKEVRVVKMEDGKAIVQGLEDGDFILEQPVQGAFEGMNVQPIVQ